MWCIFAIPGGYGSFWQEGSPLDPLPPIPPPLKQHPEGGCTQVSVQVLREELADVLLGNFKSPPHFVTN